MSLPGVLHGSSDCLHAENDNSDEKKKKEKDYDSRTVEYVES